MEAKVTKAGNHQGIAASAINVPARSIPWGVGFAAYETTHHNNLATKTSENSVPMAYKTLINFSLSLCHLVAMKDNIF